MPPCDDFAAKDNEAQALKRSGHFKIGCLCFLYSEGHWDCGFLIRHAVIDIFYAVDLLQQQNLPATLVLPLLEVILLFTGALKQDPEQSIITQAIARVINRASKPAIDQLLQQHLSI